MYKKELFFLFTHIYGFQYLLEKQKNKWYNHKVFCCFDILFLPEVNYKRGENLSLKVKGSQLII